LLLFASVIVHYVAFPRAGAVTATATKPSAKPTRQHRHDECPQCFGHVELRPGQNRCPSCEHGWLAIMPQAGPQTLFLGKRMAQVDIVGFGGAAGGGKLLALDTPVPTPSGWTTMGDIRDGDEVFDSLGNPCLVLRAHKRETPQACYRLTFDDGETIDAGAEHLWLTFDAVELAALTRRHPTWREARRYKRPSRAGGQKSAVFRAAITVRNGKHPPPAMPSPTGTVRGTAEIARTLRTPAGRANHAIPVTDAVTLPEATLPIDPYLLGIWLGDGTATNGGITTADQGILAAYRAAGFALGVIQKKAGNAAVSVTVLGLSTMLRSLGLMGNKHVPLAYLRASREQRLALLQGLMDTDGTATEAGAVEFYSCRKCLVEAVQELAASLGHKPGIPREGRATLYGKDCGPKWRLKWSPSELVFRLPRKADRQKVNGHRRTVRFRYIVACDTIASVPMRCITVDSASGMYLCGKAFIPTHNSWSLLLDPIPDMSIKGFGAVIFRRDATQLTNEGGLWDASREIYPFLKARPRESPALQWRFPGGGRISFHHLHSPDDQYAWQGAEICDLLFDELTHFEEAQFWYLISRNRSTCGVRPRCRATFNPDAGSWVKALFAPWVDGEYPDPAGPGEVRYLVRQDGYHYFRTESEAQVYAIQVLDITVGDAQHAVKSVSFVPARLDDNPALMDRNPQYRANLLSLPPVERERLLYGDWNILTDRFFDQWRADTAEGTPWHVIPTGEVPRGHTYYLGVDWGFSDPFACYLVAISHDGRMTVCREAYETGKLTSEQGDLMAGMLSAAGLPKSSIVYAGHDVFNRRLRSSGAYDEPIARTWEQMGLAVITAGRDPLNRASKFREYLRDWGADEGWPQGRPGLQVMACCSNLIRTLPLLQSDKRHPEQVDTTQDDHAYDAVGHILTSLPGRPDKLAIADNLTVEQQRAAVMDSYDDQQAEHDPRGTMWSIRT